MPVISQRDFRERDAGIDSPLPDLELPVPAEAFIPGEIVGGGDVDVRARFDQFEERVVLGGHVAPIEKEVRAGSRRAPERA